MTALNDQLYKTHFSHTLGNICLKYSSRGHGGHDGNKLRAAALQRSVVKYRKEPPANSFYNTEKLTPWFLSLCQNYYKDDKAR